MAKYEIIHGDCTLWMKERNENSIHSIVTDPPFGLIEYTGKHLEKMRNGRGGIWRLPPKFDGKKRKPLPRFTVLSEKELTNIREFFEEWGKLALKVLVPGGHLFIASNPLLTPHLAPGLIIAGFERRGEIIRLVRTLRGGDRPKLAEKKYSNVSVIPRACYEPWGLFRKPISENRVSENLERWGTGGLRRIPNGNPFPDILKSEFPLNKEKEIGPHPSLKPQKFLRQIVWSSLPLGEGIVLDPFMGSGSTIAAAEVLGYNSIGIELDPEFYSMAEEGIPRLAEIEVEWKLFEGVNNKKQNEANKKKRKLKNDKQLKVFN
jgi:site-specific DNA-methyltransferase (adenine-specific)